MANNYTLHIPLKLELSRCKIVTLKCNIIKKRMKIPHTRQVTNKTVAYENKLTKTEHFAHVWKVANWNISVTYQVTPFSTKTLSHPSATSQFLYHPYRRGRKRRCGAVLTNNSCEVTSCGRPSGFSPMTFDVGRRLYRLTRVSVFCVLRHLDDTREVLGLFYHCPFCLPDSNLPDGQSAPR